MPIPHLLSFQDIQNYPTPSDVVGLLTYGYYAPGDGGGGFYKRSPIQPSLSGYGTSATGGYFVLDGASLNVKQFGAKGDGVTDDTSAIQAAMAAANCLIFPQGVYVVSSTLTFSRSYQRLYGGSMGGYYTASSGGGAELKWNGAVGGTIMRVPTGYHNPQIERLALDANDKANHCLHLDVRAGSPIQFPFLERLAFRGYRDAALILGENNRTVFKNGAMQQMTANHLTWWGGGPTATPENVCGVLLNAQNCEFASAVTWHFDPWPAFYINNYNHIIAVSGGLNLSGVISTRATSHAIKFTQDAQLLIDGWRSEDVLLIDLPSTSSIIAPMSIRNLLQRGDAPGTEEVITLRANGEYPISVENSYIKGVIGIAVSVPTSVSLKNIVFHRVRSGTCQAGSTATTCVLDAGASDVDDYYNDCEIVITGGTGSGQSFIISDYVGATRTATITGFGDGNTFFPIPDNTSTFVIRGAPKYYAGGTSQNVGVEAQPGKRFTRTYAQQDLHFDASGALVSGMREGSILVRGIGTSGYARNLGGSFVQADVDGVTRVITFTRAEQNTSYRVLLICESFTGAPAAGSETFSIAKTVNGFTVTFNAATGAGNTRSWNWLIYRE